MKIRFAEEESRGQGNEHLYRDVKTGSAEGLNPEFAGRHENY
jgi:hypothetical protein